MLRSIALVGCVLGVCSMPTVPEHLRGGFLGREYTPTVGDGQTDDLKLAPQYLDVPLDHFDASNTHSFHMKYWLDASAWSGKPDAPVFINMPSEGPAGGVSADNLTQTFGGLRVAAEHRYFGESVPCIEGSCVSTTAVLSKYMTVEQNLADQAALVRDIQRQYNLTGAVVATGGSYAGASSSWLRTAYPDLVDAALAESGPIYANIDFFAYDEAIATALSYRAGCREAMAETMKALNDLWLGGGQEGQDDLKRAFNASFLINTPQGDTDFLYFLGDSVATSVQYGAKARVCDALARLPSKPSPQDYLANWQKYTLDALGPNPVGNGCFYNSECMKQTNSSTSARSWYWLKCSELAYLQTAPTKQASMCPASVTAERLLDQCKYIYGDGLPPTPRVDAFNAKFGGLHPEKKGQTKVAYFVFSDDPWKPAQPDADLGPTLPYVYTDCDGCAHCGAGVPFAKLALLTEKKINLLGEWLGLQPIS